MPAQQSVTAAVSRHVLALNHGAPYQRREKRYDKKSWYATRAYAPAAFGDENGRAARLKVLEASSSAPSIGD